MKPYQYSAASSSVKSNTTTDPSAMEEREGGDSSCYFPGCKKDANCNCEICLASLNATLDLMPASIHKSSLSKLFPSRPNVERTPGSFDPSLVSTPKSVSCVKLASPWMKSTARMRVKEVKEKKEEEEEKEVKEEGKLGSLGCFLGGFWLKMKMVVVLGLLVLAVESGVSVLVSGVVSRPVLSADLVRNIGERSLFVGDLSGRLRFLQDEIRDLVDHGKVSNCTIIDANWKINQDGLLLKYRCVVYKSATEEVSIWGWPLQTAGLITTGFSSCFFSVISGRVTEWPDGKIGYSIHNTNATWVHSRWDTSVVQLDPNTWVLEYRVNSISENSGLLSAVVELLKYRTLRALKRLNLEHLLSSAFEDQLSSRRHMSVPT